jgi:Ca-activated chloride channel family protein
MELANLQGMTFSPVHPTTWLCSHLFMPVMQAAAEKERLRKQAAKERAAANASLQAAQQQPSAQGAATQATTQATGAAAPHGVAEQGQSGGARPQQQAPSIPTGGPALQKAPQRQQEHFQAQQQLQGTQDQVVHAQQQGQQPQPQGEGKQQQAATKQKQKNKHQQGQQQQQQGQSGQSGDVLQPGLLKVRQADGGERLYKTSQFEQISKKPLKERKKQ